MLNTIRWILLFPAFVVVFYSVLLLYYKFFGFGDSWLHMAILPAVIIAMCEYFFVWILSPKHKNFAAICATIVAVLFVMLMFCGLAQTY